jgi:hypothetical protein
MGFQAGYMDGLSKGNKKLEDMQITYAASLSTLLFI